MRLGPVHTTSESSRRRWRPMPVLLVAFMVLIIVVSSISLAFATDGSFTDVSAGHPYYTAICHLASDGIIDGYGDGRFGPADPVRRQQFAKMMVLTAGYPVSELDICPFADVEISGAVSLYPDNFVAVCFAKGITLGKTATAFDPYNYITRYQVISMVVRAGLNMQPGFLPNPPAGWTSAAGWAADPTHGANAARAEYNGLLSGLDLAALSPYGNMSRGEVAQVLHNFLTIYSPPTTTTTTTEPPTTTSTSTTSTSTTTTTVEETTTTSSSTTSSDTTSTSTTDTTLPEGSGYVDLAATITGPPAIDAYTTNGLDVFARGTDGQLKYNWYNGAWHIWESLGIEMASGSGAASVGGPTSPIDVFVRGTDDRLHHARWSTTWSAWEDLFGILTSDPAVASQSPGKLDVFVRGPAGHLFQKSFDGTSWSAYTDLGGALNSEPAAVSWGTHRIDVFAQAMDNTLWHTWWNGMMWQEENLGGTLTSGPAVCSRGPGMLDVFARGYNNTIWHIEYKVSWSTWKDLGGSQVASSPDAASWGSNRIDLVVRGTNGHLWHRWWNGTDWLPAY